MRLLVLVLALGCASSAGRLTASDGKPFQCRRVCPVGAELPPRPLPLATAADVRVLEDCCVGPGGADDTWSSVAWNCLQAQRHGAGRPPAR